MNHNYVGNLINEFDHADYHQLDKAYYNKQLICLYAYYHYFSADTSKIDDVLSGCTYEEGSKDNIDGLFIDEDADILTIDLLMSLPERDGKIDVPSAVALFGKTEQAYFEGLANGFERDVLNEITKDPIYQANQVKPLAIYLLTDFVPGSIKEKNEILKALAQVKPLHPYVTYRVIFGQDIENEILDIEDPREYVENGSIRIDSEKNILHFGDEGSLIVNASARSIKELYEKYAYRGLFAQNLRYYIKNAKIDEGIVDSIQNRSNNFWYYNNGLIIICNGYTLSGNEIWLEDFSIINGGQTTFLIGETDFTDDFYLQCKIVKNKYETSTDKTEFIASVAEASNTQKPIKVKDLIANRKEQRFLKERLAKADIFCSVKRGQKINKKVYSLPWQNTTNEEIAQFLYSFMYQCPGSARNGKSALLSNDDKYSLLFGKTYDVALLKDFMMIKIYYKMWEKKVSKENYTEDPMKSGLVKNGLLFTAAIIGALWKLSYHPAYFGQYLARSNTDERMEILSQFDIDHAIFRPEATKEDYFRLFEFCYQNIYLPGYNYLVSFKPSYNSYSNFTKIDKNYSTYLINPMMIQFKTGLNPEANEVLKGILYPRSGNEAEHDEKLLTLYSHSSAASLSEKTPLPKEETDMISEELTKYRTKTYRATFVKPYEVFTNAQRYRIATYGASSLEDLANLKCLNKDQLEKYGEDILEILRRIEEKQ